MNKTTSISNNSNNQLAYLLDIEKQLDSAREMLRFYRESIAIGHIEGARDASISKKLQKLISEVTYINDRRIEFKPERRTELIQDFLKLRDFKALNEKEIGDWLCHAFQGFVMPEDKKLITPKIGFEDLRYFIRCIYSKYDGENRNKMKQYREILELTHLAENKTTNLIKHFADPKPKKYPRALEI